MPHPCLLQHNALPQVLWCVRDVSVLRMYAPLLQRAATMGAHVRIHVTGAAAAAIETTAAPTALAASGIKDQTPEVAPAAVMPAPTFAPSASAHSFQADCAEAASARTGASRKGYPQLCKL